MDTAFGAVWGFLRVLQSGVATQWWGLACPPHCGPPTFGLVLAAFLLGFLSCLGLTAFLLLWYLGFQPPIHLRAASSPFVLPALSILGCNNPSPTARPLSSPLNFLDFQLRCGGRPPVVLTLSEASISTPQPRTPAITFSQRFGRSLLNWILLALLLFLQVRGTPCFC